MNKKYIKINQKEFIKTLEDIIELCNSAYCDVEHAYPLLDRAEKYLNEMKNNTFKYYYKRVTE